MKDRFTLVEGTSRGAMAGSKLKAAFTLAEVLITLGIIGVVAAMTLPAIINKMEDKILESQNKKAQTVLANGFRMLMAKEDVSQLSYTTFASCQNDTECIAKEMKKVFNIIAD